VSVLIPKPIRKCSFVINPFLKKKMAQTTKTISFNDELQEQLENVVNELNKQRITGAITQSKIIRIALAEYIEKINKIKKINKEYADAKKTAEDLLKENGY
jgi:metal-responsive CopG/Arc/MetJ family transcriptional regulator